MNTKQTENETGITQEAPTKVELLFKELTDHEPKPIAHFVPSNAAEQKRQFLAEAARNPVHSYDKLDSIDFETMQAGIQEATLKLSDTLSDEPIKREVYEQFGDRYAKVSRFMQVASLINHSENEVEKQALSDEYMRLNIELYGEPDETTYRSLVNDALNSLRTKKFDEKGQKIYDELLGLMPRAVMELGAERFRPSNETIEWAGKVIEALHGGLLAHIPDDKDSFNDQEIKSVLDDIIKEEFTDSKTGINAAEGWEVVIEEATALNVKAVEKKVVVPLGKEYSRDILKGRVSHELGVHMLRSIMGEQTDIDPLRTGLSDYYDSEEGLGAVAEQALKGKYRVAGEGHYITTGLVYFDKKDFRDTFEIKWRMAVLSGAKDGEELTDAAIEKARSTAFGSVNRILRGTDTLPWFKDLAYYNGADRVWKYLEDHKGDDEYLSLLFLGKGDPVNDSHRRIFLESSTK